MRLIIGALIVASSVAFAQSARSPLQFRVTTGEYFADGYVERPITVSPFIFFRGEPIKLRLRIHAAEIDALLVLRSLESADIFLLTMHRDGAPVAAHLEFGDVKWYGLDGRGTAVRLSEPVRLNPGEELVWSAELSSDLSPGLYEINFAVMATDGESRAVLPYVSDFVFEIKARTQAYSPEILRREALRFCAKGDTAALARADATVDELLRIHPTSALAHLVRSRIASARGSRDATHTMRALALLEADSDTLLRQFKSPEERSELRRQVAASIRE